jgi:hypothetical protein
MVSSIVRPAAKLAATKPRTSDAAKSFELKIAWLADLAEKRILQITTAS